MFFDWSWSGGSTLSSLEISPFNEISTVEKYEDGRYYVLGNDTIHMNLHKKCFSAPLKDDSLHTDTNDVGTSHFSPRQPVQRSLSSPSNAIERRKDQQQSKRRRLLICRDCRLLWDTESARTGGPPGISIQALGTAGSRFFQRRSMQGKCRRPAVDSYLSYTVFFHVSQIEYVTIHGHFPR